MYKNQSRWSSTISRYFGLTFTNLFLVFFLFFCSQLSLASAQTNTSENLQGQCHFKIQSIEKVKDPANSSIPPTVGWITTILPDNWTKEKNWQFYSGAVWYKIIWDRHCENALALAEALENHAEIADVKYPFLPSHPQYELAKKQMKGGGGIVTFEVKGGKERAFRFIDALEMILYTSNLGDSRSIATHPATTTHAKLSDAERADLGIRPGSIRLSEIGRAHV